MEPFIYEALPSRVVFGSGTVARTRQEVERLGARRALVLSTPGRGEHLANEVSSLLGDLSAGVHAGAVMHTPVDATERALGVACQPSARDCERRRRLDPSDFLENAQRWRRQNRQNLARRGSVGFCR